MKGLFFLSVFSTFYFSDATPVITKVAIAAKSTKTLPSSTCSFPAQSSTASSLHCGQYGSLAPNYIMQLNSLTAGGVNDCSADCYANKGCVSLGFQSSTNNCTLYGKTLNAMHIKVAPTGQTLYYNKNCFVKSCSVISTTATTSTTTSTTPSASPSTSTVITTSTSSTQPAGPTDTGICGAAFSATNGRFELSDDIGDVVANHDVNYYSYTRLYDSESQPTFFQMDSGCQLTPDGSNAGYFYGGNIDADNSDIIEFGNYGNSLPAFHVDPETFELSSQGYTFFKCGTDQVTLHMAANNPGGCAETVITATGV